MSERYIYKEAKSGMHLIRRFYEQDYDFGENGEPRLTYLVATIPRTGSTYFCINLWKTGVLGAPMEYINLPNHDALIQRLSGGDLDSYWEAIKKVRTSYNGVFGYKAFVQNFKLVALASSKLLSQVSSDYVIYLTRKDKVSQAISYARAIMSGIWFSGFSYSSPPEYSFQQIFSCYKWIQAQEAAWETLFSRTETVPLRVTYEEFLSDKKGMIKNVKHHLRVFDEDESLIIPALSKQSDDESHMWRMRFLEELQSFGFDELTLESHAFEASPLGPLPSTE